VRLALVLAVALVAACKGDPVQCEQACRNYATLTYWDEHDAEIAKAPPERREGMKHDALAKFANNLESGIDLCVNQCVSAGNEDQTRCMAEAKTAGDARTCVK
jgi:hypothetical protein